MKLEALLEGKAFSRALAGESVTDSMKNKYDPDKGVYNGLTDDELVEYAKIIADKIRNNLQNGHT